MKKIIFHSLILLCEFFTIVSICLGAIPLGLLWLIDLTEKYLCDWFDMDRYKGKYYPKFKGE